MKNTQNLKVKFEIEKEISIDSLRQEVGVVIRIGKFFQKWSRF